MTTWISIPLQVEEKEALHKLAEQELRNPRNQAALIFPKELERLGYLKIDPDIHPPESSINDRH